MANKPWDPKRMALREALREIRSRKGLTQTELSQILGRQQSYISKYENGERRLEYLEVMEILDACEHSVQEFQAVYETKIKKKKVEK